MEIYLVWVKILQKVLHEGGGLLIDSYFIEYMAFQYHVGPFHLREAIPRFGDLGWLAPALSDF